MAAPKQDRRHREERLGFRVDEHTKALIERAAQLERRKLTDYCMTALTEAARRTIDASGKIVATIANGDGVDALGWDASQKLLYIPAGRDSSVTIVHVDGPDKYTVVATVTTMAGAKTIGVDPVKHVAYLFQPEYGPAPAPAPGTPAPPPGSRPPRGPVIGAYFFAISH